MTPASPYTGTTATTFTMSVVNPYGQEAKPNFQEACVVVNVGAMTGSGVSFQVEEFVDGNWIPVGATGTITGTGSAVIDSLGPTASGTTTFTASTNPTTRLRLLGKGTDTRVVVGVAGVFGTLSYTVDYIGYSG